MKKCKFTFLLTKTLREILLSEKLSFNRLWPTILQNQHFHIIKLYTNTILNFIIHRDNFLMINNYVVNRVLL